MYGISGLGFAAHALQINFADGRLAEVASAQLYDDAADCFDAVSGQRLSDAVTDDCSIEGVRTDADGVIVSFSDGSERAWSYSALSRCGRPRELRVRLASGGEKAARVQGYAPEVVVCAGETTVGRPSPFMIWKALAELEVWPASAVVKVDDAPVGIAEGKNAGCFTIGVAACGNAVGLDLESFLSLADSERRVRIAVARTELLAAGADAVIDTVADLPSALRDRGIT